MSDDLDCGLHILLAAASSASGRLLEGDQWSSGEHPMVQFVDKHRYLQQQERGPGSSCGTNNRNNPPCHRG